MEGDGQIEMIDPGSFQADDDAGQIGQLLHQADSVNGCVGEFLCFVRGAVLADEENQFFRADVNSGKVRFGFLKTRSNAV